MAASSDFNSDLLARRGVSWAALGPEEQDWALADRVLDLFEEAGDGMTGYARAAVLVASMAKCNPARSYRTAWKTLDVWRQRVPPRQAPAMPLRLALACVTWLTVAGKPSLAAGVLLCFCGLLRSAEMLSLRGRAVVRTMNGYVLLLGDTKRGQEQTVLIQECSIVAWLDGFLARHRLRSADYLVPVGYTTFARWLTKACEGLGMSHVHWTTHSLRRGGATALMRAGCSWPALLHYGRWASARSAKEYVRRGEVALIELEEKSSPAVWARLTALAAVGPWIWHPSLGFAKPVKH